MRGWSISLGLVLAFLPFFGCNEDETLMEMFDAPIDVAVVEPNPILEVHTGFVTNLRTGKVVKLDLKHNTFLRDNPLGSWIRATPIATGYDRYTEQIAAAYEYTSDTDQRVTLFVSDSSRQQLLVVPYLDTLAERGSHCTPSSSVIPRYPVCLYDEKNGEPIPLDGSRSLPVLDASGSPLSGYSVGAFRLREGKTTTERWTATYQNGRFYFSGSRSGVQDRTATPGEVYFSDHNELELLITAGEGAGELPEGATFSLYTDSGIIEFDLDGVVEDIQLSQEYGRLFATVQDTTEEQTADGTVFHTRGHLLSFPLFPDSAAGPSGALGTPTRIELCPDPLENGGCAVDAEPLAMDIDPAHQRLFIADASDSGVIYQVDHIDLEPALLDVQVISGFLPNVDLAYVEDEEAEEPYQHLFVANTGEGSASIFDVEARKLVDFNPFTAEVDPVPLFSPALGMAAGKISVSINEYTDEGERKRSKLVGVTTYKGDLIILKGADGCQPYVDVNGPYIEAAEFTSDQGATSNPTIDADAITGREAAVNPCGGISLTQSWTFVYDEELRAYRVRGSVVNERGEYQQNLAYEDERYVSDGGEISVLIRSGTLPTTQGDTLRVDVTANVSPISLGGVDVNGHAGALPADFEMYDESWGDRNQDWTAVRWRTVAVVPGSADDRVFKLDAAVPGVKTPQLALFR